MPQERADSAQPPSIRYRCRNGVTTEKSQGEANRLARFSLSPTLKEADMYVNISLALSSARNGGHDFADSTPLIAHV